MTYFDDDQSPALALWGERLNSYLDGQEGVEALRPRAQPNPPWPEADNPMLGYLLARAMEIHEEGTGPRQRWPGWPYMPGSSPPSIREPTSSATSAR